MKTTTCDNCGTAHEGGHGCPMCSPASPPPSGRRECGSITLPVHITGIGSIKCLRDAANRLVCPRLLIEQAEYVCTAVNQHQALVEENERLREALRRLEGFARQVRCGAGNTPRRIRP